MPGDGLVHRATCEALATRVAGSHTDYQIVHEDSGLRRGLGLGDLRRDLAGVIASDLLGHLPQRAARLGGSDLLFREIDTDEAHTQSLPRFWYTARVKKSAPAALRNREPIAEVLARHLPKAGTVLTIAEGSGEHVLHFAKTFSALTWQPSDLADSLASISAWRDEAALPNLAAPIELDVTWARWPIERADAITCINMVHISPWEATLGLFAGAARTLAPGALLYLYGPYRFDGKTAPSNDEFDASLRARDPRWGVRDVRDLQAAATAFTLDEAVAMPANNHSLLFRRRGALGE